MSESLDPYAVLGVTAAASPVEIAHGFRAKLRALHPDTRYPGAPAAAEAQLRQLLAAYNQLRQSVHSGAAEADTATDPTSPQQSETSAGPSQPSPDEPTKIPVTYHRARSNAAPDRGMLWIGPVRWHR